MVRLSLPDLNLLRHKIEIQPDPFLLCGQHPFGTQDLPEGGALRQPF